MASGGVTDGFEKQGTVVLEQVAVENRKRLFRAGLLGGVQSLVGDDVVEIAVLIEIATGLIMALAFAAVVTTFTEWLTGLLPNTEDFFSDETGSFGAFLNALIAFLIMGAVVYFFIVLPYTKARERFFPTEEAGAAPDVALLEEIRDLLKARGGAV